MDARGRPRDNESHVSETLPTAELRVLAPERARPESQDGLGTADGRTRARPSLVARARARLSPWHAALAAVLAWSTVLNVHNLRQNGFANTFYSAAVKSDLLSLHNLFYVAFDPGGMVTVDKPPIGIWAQVLSARLLGFSPRAVLAPEALAGVLAVLVMYFVISPRFGRGAGVLSALALAVFPSFVAVSRDNGPDPIMILFMLLACWAVLRAIEGGRLRWLLACAVLVGLAFNTKTLAALLVVPGIGLGYFVCGQRTLVRRSTRLVVAGAVMLVACGAWIAFVDLMPATHRPWVGGTKDNSELNLTFGYNGIGRVGGQNGGPGQVRIVSRGPLLKPELDMRPTHTIYNGVEAHLLSSNEPTGASHAAGAFAGAGATHESTSAAGASTPAAFHPQPALATVPPVNSSTVGVQPVPSVGRAAHPNAFGGPTGPFRLFGVSLGGQCAWMLPFALLSLLAIALIVRGRRDSRLAVLLVMGGWFVVEAVVLSQSSGIVHPYYVSALGPGTAALVGAGAYAMAALARRTDWRVAIGPLALALTALGQFMLLRRDHYIEWWLPILAIGLTVGVAVLLLRPRRSVPAMVSMVLMLLVAPTVYAATTWEVPVDGTFPAAGPHIPSGSGGYGVSGDSLVSNTDLANWIRAHDPGKRWALLTVASDSAAPLWLLGLPTAAMGGYSGVDPALDGAKLAHLVQQGLARYVLLGGAYADRGGNAASRAVDDACAHVPTVLWRGIPGGVGATVSLFDCRGDEKGLLRAPP